jgi:hypothetical protein
MRGDVLRAEQLDVEMTLAQRVEPRTELALVRCIQAEVVCEIGVIE